MEENCCHCFEYYMEKYKLAIKHSLSQTAYQYRDDLEQELYILLFKKTQNIDNIDFKQKAPSFWKQFKGLKNK